VVEKAKGAGPFAVDGIGVGRPGHEAGAPSGIGWGPWPLKNMSRRFYLTIVKLQFLNTSGRGASLTLTLTGTLPRARARDGV